MYDIHNIYIYVLHAHLLGSSRCKPGALPLAAYGQAVKGHARRLDDQRVGVAAPRRAFALTFMPLCDVYHGIGTMFGVT